jgi:sugar O-acyltransferase (sialic acid O-acetyltransferase NeuD family)
MQKDEDLVPKNLVVVGAGGHAVSVAEVAYSAGFQIKCFVDPGKAGQTLLEFPVLSDLAELDDLHSYSICIAIGDNMTRALVFDKIATAFGSLTFPALVHKSAVVSRYAALENGTVIMPNASIGPQSHIGKFCIVNTSASIDHDASVAPGVSTGGGVKIGYRSAISIGAVIKHGIIIGQDTVLGGNSYLNQNLGDELLAYGSPAKVIRERKAGDRYL